MTKANIKYLSHKIKRKNKRSDGKNHIVAVSEPKKVKNKDISKGGNLLEAPKDERMRYLVVCLAISKIDH